MDLAARVANGVEPANFLRRGPDRRWVLEGSGSPGFGGELHVDRMDADRKGFRLFEAGRKRRRAGARPHLRVSSGEGFVTVEGGVGVGATDQPELELIADERCIVGEGPLWHPTERRLYWGDIVGGKLFRYDPAQSGHEQIYQGEMVGGFTIQADGALLLFGENGSVRTWRDGVIETVIEEIPEERGGRFNDVIADPEGRVFCGTMPIGDRLGRLYRLDPDGTLTAVLDGINISNGMGFTPDLRQMYHTDTYGGTITVFDYDRARGELSNGRVLVSVPPEKGFPDGMTVDAEGYVWSAHWDGGALYRYAPTGENVRRVDFPARKVSSITFGGDDYAHAYVTTAGGENRESEGEGAGALFRVNLGVKGKPPFLSTVGL